MGNRVYMVNMVYMGNRIYMGNRGYMGNRVYMDNRAYVGNRVYAGNMGYMDNGVYMGNRVYQYCSGGSIYFSQLHCHTISLFFTEKSKWIKLTCLSESRACRYLTHLCESDNTICNHFNSTRHVNVKTPATLLLLFLQIHCK